MRQPPKARGKKEAPPDNRSKLQRCAGTWTPEMGLSDDIPSRTYSTLAKAKGEWQKRLNRDTALTSTAKIVGHELALRWVNGKAYIETGKLFAFPSVGTLAADLDIARSTTQVAISLLENHGYLVVCEHRGRSNQNDYELVNLTPESARPRGHLIVRKHPATRTLSNGEGAIKMSGQPTENVRPADNKMSGQPDPTYLRDLSEDSFEKTVHHRGGEKTDHNRIRDSRISKNPEAFIERLYQIDPEGALPDTILNYIGEERFERLALRCYNAYRFDEDAFVDRLTNLQLCDDPTEDPHTIVNFLNGEFIRLLPKKADRGRTH